MPGLPFLKTYKKMIEESNPFNRIHRLIDTFEEFSKFLASISLREFIASGNPEDTECRDFNHFLSHRLYAPTLGTWHEFLYRSSKILAGSGTGIGSAAKAICALLGYLQNPGPPPDISLVYKEKTYQVNNLQDAFNLFTELRNDYAHGATPTDDSCRNDYFLFLPLLDFILEKAHFLNDFTLEPEALDGISQPALRGPNREILPLYPFMLHSDGEFFYFTDAKLKYKEKLTFLSYCTAQKIIDGDAYHYLKKLLPGFDAVEDEIDLRKQRLLDTVIGRYEDAKTLEQTVLQSTQTRVFYVFGDPGIGKSAMAAYLEEYFFSGCVKALHIFVHNEAHTLRPEAVFKSLAKPLAAAGLVQSPVIDTANPAAIKKHIDTLLRLASDNARLKNTRIIIIIDGLDEAYNASEHLYNILPFTPPPQVHIIYFSRRKEEIYSRVYRGSTGWAAVEELKPLNKAAIRAILWQAISKYAVDETVVDRVTEASQGNPLYLRFLVTAVLEKRLELSGAVLLPTDILEYYGRLLHQVVRRHPDLPIIETALAFAACCEPLHQEQIKKILDDESLEKILLSIDALSEIIRPVSRNGYQKKFQLFHKSIADFLLEQYAETAKKIETAALFSVVREKRDSLEKWFPYFLEGKSLLKPLDEKNLTQLVMQSSANPFAHQLLVNTVAAHPRVEEILVRCYEFVATRRNLNIFSLVNDSLLKVVEVSEQKYVRLVTRLNRRYPEDENLERHILDALVLLRFSEEYYHNIIDLVTGYLLSYPLVKRRGRRTRYARIIEVVAGYTRSPETFGHLRQICADLLNLRRGEKVPAETFARIEQLLIREVQFVLQPRFNRLVTKLRHRDNRRFITRGNETYRRLLAKIGLGILRLPGEWLNFWRLFFRLARLVLKSGVNTQKELTKRLDIFAKILQRSFPLIFTSELHPVSDPMGISAIKQIEEVIRARLQAIGVGDIDLYRLVKREISGEKGEESELPANLAYLFAIVLQPLLEVLWNYSGVGLEAMPGYTEPEREKIRSSLGLLKGEEPITPADEDLLMEFLSIDDAWKNYFAKAGIIIHGNREFTICQRVLKRMLAENPLTCEKDENPDKQAITERLRIFRQYFAVHSYLIRRATDVRLVEEMSESLEFCLDRLKHELETTPGMMAYFVKPTLFGQGDPFNPVLPMGIYRGRVGDTRRGEDKLDRVIDMFLQTGAQQTMDMKLKLADKIFSELLSLALFYPGLALRTALRYYKENRDKDNALAEILIEKIYLVDLLCPGNLRAVALEMGFGWEELKKKLLECKEKLQTRTGTRTGSVETITREIRVFAWHECITALMVSYPKIRDMLIHAAAESFKERVSLSILVQRIVLEFLRLYFSGEIGEEVKNLFLPGVDFE